MTRIEAQKPDLESALSHYGVKGMQWGVRKAAIKTARKEVRAQKKEIREVAKTKGVKSEEYGKLQAAYLRNPDRGVAATMTRGEQIAVVLLTGPAGLGVNAGLSLRADVVGTRAEQRRK